MALAVQLRFWRKQEHEHKHGLSFPASGCGGGSSLFDSSRAKGAIHGTCGQYALIDFLLGATNALSRSIVPPCGINEKLLKVIVEANGHNLRQELNADAQGPHARRSFYHQGDGLFNSSSCLEGVRQAT